MTNDRIKERRREIKIRHQRRRDSSIYKEKNRKFQRIFQPSEFQVNHIADICNLKPVD